MDSEASHMPLDCLETDDVLKAAGGGTPEVAVIEQLRP